MAKSRYSPATTGHPRLGASRDASAAILAASSGLVRTLLSAQRHCIRVIVVDDEPGAAREQLDGVREGRRHHRSSGRDGINEDAGRHLLLGVIGQDDHFAGLDQCGERRHIAIVGIEDDGRGDPEALRLLHPVLTVGLSVGGEDLGVGLAGHQVARPHREIVQRSHGLNGSFDSFARPDESPREYDGPTGPFGHDTSSRDGSAVGDDAHFERVDIEAVAQSRPGRLGHDHHVVRQGGNIVQHGPLMWRRVGEDRVGNHDGGDVETAQDLEHLVTVGASVESVFVVHHRHIELVEQVRARDQGASLIR